MRDYPISKVVSSSEWAANGAQLETKEPILLSAKRSAELSTTRAEKCLTPRKTSVLISTARTIADWTDSPCTTPTTLAARPKSHWQTVQDRQMAASLTRET